jgi:hypothetical protein
MATMDPGQRGFGQQRQFNLPDLPFKDLGRLAGLPFDIGADPLSYMRPRPQGGMRPQGQIPPELLEMLMAQFFGQGGGGMAGPRRAMRGAQRGGQRPPMGGGRPPQRPPMGGGRPPMGRPPMGGPQRGGQRPPMGGQRLPVVRMDDLVRALNPRGGGAPRADMPVPQARR